MIKHLDLLRCPTCNSELELTEDSYLECIRDNCKKTFPIINCTPILIDESLSVFKIKDFEGQANRVSSSGKEKISKFKNLIPKSGKNLKAKKNYPKLKTLLLNDTTTPKILIIGSGDIGKGLETIINDPKIDFIETDVKLGGRVELVCDAHDLPFPTERFDGVIIQAVLEHVCDPNQCVEEIYRVLKSDGLIYAETPFMQQVHTGRYDFTRFSLLGHRRLFRNFETIEDGATGGTGMALSWSYENFLLSFFKSKFLRIGVIIFARYTSFWLKYFDILTINKPGTIDAASGFFFLGRKSEEILPDNMLIDLYRGAQ